MKIRIDNEGYKNKPKKFPAISDRLSSNPAREFEFETFCDQVGEEGHAFCVADFLGNKRCSDEFKSQQLFGLDFDNKDENRKVTFDMVYNRAESYGLPIALAYETFSSVNMDRFRVVFMNAFPVCDVHVAKIIIDALIEIFPECDTACSDVSRIFLGGKRVIFSQEKYIPIERLMMNFPRALKERDEKHYKSKVETFCRKHNLARMGGYAHIRSKITEKCYEFSENEKRLYFNFDKENEHTNVKAETKKIRGFNFSILKNKCRLYSEFVAGEKTLHHNELFGIATNLNNIESGKNRFLAHVEKIEEWKYYMHYMTTQGYKPMSCENFCPYHTECNHAANMVLTAKTNRNSVVKLKEQEYCSLDEAVEDVKEALRNAIDTPFDGINIITAQTAIGKTECYINLINNSDKKFIVAVPTNILKEEVYQRLRYMEVSGVVKTESIQTLENLDNEIGENIRKFNALGAYNDLVDYIKKIAKEENNEYLLNYIKPLGEYCEGEHRVIVTTHKKLLNNRSEIVRDFEIIVDEDILFSSLKNSCTVTVDDLKKVRDIPKVKQFLSNYQNSDEVYIKTDVSADYISYETMEKRGITTNINGFLSSTAACINGNKVNCFVPPSLMKMKYTVLSATANEKIYKLFFPDRSIRCVKCKEAKYVGKLIQDCTRSYSRRDIDADEDFFYRLKEENQGIKNIITFKKYKEQADNCIMHFGNTEGVDAVKGEDLLVVGTPHNDEIVYKLIAKHLGIETNESMRFLEVEDEAYKYWLHTYENPDLRAIQLYFLKSELIQAVGRARLLRHDCTVKLYASVPLPQAIIE